MDGIAYLLQMVAGMLVVEGLRWTTWFLRQVSHGFSAAAQESTRIFFPNGGKLFAPIGGSSSFLLALLMLQIVRAYIQQRTPCPGTDPQNIFHRLVTGAIVEGYGFSPSLRPY